MTKQTTRNRPVHNRPSSKQTFIRPIHNSPRSWQTTFITDSFWRLSVMNESIMNVVCFTNGLLWAGLRSGGEISDSVFPKYPTPTFQNFRFRLLNIKQWFPNCGTRTSSGTRRPSRWYTNRPTFCFSSQNNTFTAIIFTCRVLLINSWIFVWPSSLRGF